MQFLSPTECDDWVASHGRGLPKAGTYEFELRIKYPSAAYRYFAIATWMSVNLFIEKSTLLWTTEWGIWPSSENWNLYETLRNQYGNSDKLCDSPGHLFCGDETADLATFLQFAMLNGWGGYVLAEADRVNAFFSHDEYFDFYARDPNDLEMIRAAFANDWG
jgi:hypothetical protein